MRIERRLRQPRWLLVAVPGGLARVRVLRLRASCCSRPGTTRSRATGRSSTPRSSNSGALGQTLIAATPLAFTGLAAAAAFRMRLFNIGGEGQLYIGAITAAAAGLYLGGNGGPSRVRDRGDGRRRLRGRRRSGR